MLNARRLANSIADGDIMTSNSARLRLVLPPHEALELIQVRTCTHETSRVSASAACITQQRATCIMQQRNHHHHHHVNHN
jgi:hypothetical protein